MPTVQASQAGSYRRGRDAVKRLRNAVREVLPVLAELEQVQDLPDHIGRYDVAPGEPINMDEVRDFLDFARFEHQGALSIIVLGHVAVDGGKHVQADQDPHA